MDAIIKITAGPETGQQFRCSTPETIVGRSPRCAIRLASPSISYEHALISRVAEEFFIENLSANGTFVNNDRITAKTRLRSKDQVRLGDETVARVESVPASARAGSSRTTLLVIFVILLVLSLLVVFIDPFGGETTTGMGMAYVKILDFAQQEIAAGRLPRDTADLMQEAWRMDIAGNRDGARKDWLRLRTTLDSVDNTTNYQQDAANYPHALELLRKPDGRALSDEELGAALVQFAQQMERRR